MFEIVLCHKEKNSQVQDEQTASCTTIPNKLTLVIKHSSQHFPTQPLSDSLTIIIIIINDEEVDLSNVTLKSLLGNSKPESKLLPLLKKI